MARYHVILIFSGTLAERLVKDCGYPMQEFIIEAETQPEALGLSLMDLNGELANHVMRMECYPL